MELLHNSDIIAKFALSIHRMMVQEPVQKFSRGFAFAEVEPLFCTMTLI